MVFSGSLLVCSLPAGSAGRGEGRETGPHSGHGGDGDGGERGGAEGGGGGTDCGAHCSSFLSSGVSRRPFSCFTEAVRTSFSGHFPFRSDTLILGRSRVIPEGL